MSLTTKSEAIILESGPDRKLKWCRNGEEKARKKSFTHHAKKIPQIEAKSTQLSVFLPQNE